MTFPSKLTPRPAYRPPALGRLNNQAMYQLSCPWHHLAYAIVEQAVVDFKHLRALGLIQAGGKVVESWPKMKVCGHVRNKPAAGYMGPGQVLQLIAFIRGESSETLLALLSSPVKIETIRSKLRL
jgi:hypothetical protein